MADESLQLLIVVPVLNDAPALRRLLTRIGPVLGLPHRERLVVIADGGSSDQVEEALGNGEVLVRCPPGRGSQLHAGSVQHAADWIWMLHADSEISDDVIAQLLELVSGPPAWGRFDIAVEGLPVVSWFMNQRSAHTGICTGDQGIVVHRELLEAIGGVPPQALMEDIELSRRLKRLQPPVRLRARIGTSSRRWQQQGVLRCTLQMWWFRLRYFFGADPDQLARAYYRPRGSEQAS